METLNSTKPYADYHEQDTPTDPVADTVSRSFIDDNHGIVGVATTSEQIIAGSDGLYLSPNQASKYGESLTLAQARLLPDTMYLGAGKSHHNVLLGEIEISDTTGEVGTLAVALKGYTLESGKAFEEMQAYLTAIERGVHTFEPLAIYKSDQQAVLVTKKFDDLYVMDSLKWYLRPGDPDYEDQIAFPVMQMADGLADIHIKGLFHGDFVPKNCAVDNQNQFVVFDFEDTVVIDSSESIVNHLNGNGFIEESRALNDVVHFWEFQTSPYESEDNTFLIEEDAEVVVAEFIRLMLDPYIESLTQRLVTISGGDMFDADSFRAAAIRRLSLKVGAKYPVTFA